MIGQYSRAEISEKIRAASWSHTKDILMGRVVIQFGKRTLNYYREEADGSWTNYDCKTL